VGRVTGEKPFTVAVRGEDIGLLKEYAAALKQEIRKIPGIVDLEVTLEHDIPEYRLTVDGERASDVGVTTGAVVRTVGALIGGQVVSTYEDPDGDAVNVRVRLPVAMRQDPSQVERGPAGGEPGAGRGRPRAAGRSGTVFVERHSLRDQQASAHPGGRPLGEPRRVAAGRGDEQGQDDRRRMPMAPGYRVVFTGRGRT